LWFFYFKRLSYYLFGLRLAALFSGGKDSTYAIYLMERRGHHVEHLLTILPESDESLYFHYPNIELTKLQAKAMMKHQLVERCGIGKDEELSALARLIERVLGMVDGVVSGAIASRFQLKAFKEICEKYNLSLFAPLWGMNPLTILWKMINEGFEIIITGVAAAGLGKELLGARLTPSLVKEIQKVSDKFGIHPAGEGGEFETFVLDAPIFKQRIEITEAEADWRGDRGFLKIKGAKLVRKKNY